MRTFKWNARRARLRCLELFMQSVRPDADQCDPGCPTAALTTERQTHPLAVPTRITKFTAAIIFLRLSRGQLLPFSVEHFFHKPFELAACERAWKRIFSATRWNVRPEFSFALSLKAQLARSVPWSASVCVALREASSLSSRIQTGTSDLTCCMR